MKTLMELVDKCKPFEYSYTKDIEELFLKAEELKQLGFRNASEELLEKVDKNHKLKEISKLGYLMISPKKIKAYLKMKVARYNKEHRNDPKVTSDGFSINFNGGFSPLYLSVDGNCSFVTLDDAVIKAIVDAEQAKNDAKQKEETFDEHTCDYHKTDKNTIGRFMWTETPVKDYKDVPPANILEIMKDHVRKGIYDYFTIASVSHVVDPILLGRVYGCEERFFIPKCQWGDDIQIDDLV